MHLTGRVAETDVMDWTNVTFDDIDEDGGVKRKNSTDTARLESSSFSSRPASLRPVGFKKFLSATGPLTY